MEVQSLVPAPRLRSLIETQLDLDTIDPVPSITHIQLPSTSAFSRRTRPVVKTLNCLAASKDEADFQSRNAATAASVFFRAGLENDKEKYPRAVSWRVIEGSSTFEVRVLDLTRPESQPDRTEQTLRYVFPSSICSGGVALADSALDHAVCALVMTKNNELYTLSLRSSLFSQQVPTSDEIERTTQYFRPSALSISTFYKIFASSSHDVLISLGDGRISRLSRGEGEDGSQWAERTYDDGQWAASFRGLLPFYPRPTIHHEGASLNLKTIHMAVISPSQEHILTTGLDHMFKAWSLSTGKPTIVRDMLNLPLLEGASAKQTLDPQSGTSLRIFESRSGGGYTYYAVTFSTQKSGLFKFWAVADPEDSEAGIRDCFENKELKLPDLGDGALWTLSDFDISASIDTSEIDIWTLMRLNKRYQLFHRRFHDIHDLGERWDTGWVATIVDSRRLNADIGSVHQGSACLHHSARCLGHIFQPGRTPAKVIDTAISVYMQAKDERSKTIKEILSKRSLAERVTSAVNLQISKIGNASPHSASELLDIATREWSNFSNIIQDVNSQRWEPVSLAIDVAERTPWLAFADGFSVIRDCSDLELLAHNACEILADARTIGVIPSIEESNQCTSNLQELASVVSSATMFRANFPSSLRQSCEYAFDEDLWTDPLASPLDRMQNLYDKCNFAEDISSRQFEELRSSLEDVGGFMGLRSHHFRAIAQQISTLRREPKMSFTSTGLGTLVCGAQSMISLQLRVLQDLLYMLVFITGEVDPAEDLSEALELEETFLALVEQTKRAQLAQWLGANSWTVTLGNHGNIPREVTVLRDLFAPDIKPHAENIQDGRSGLTQAIQHLIIWVAGDNEIDLEDAITSIQCDFLKRHSLLLAEAFQRFLPSTAWATYVQGRLYLLREEFSDAAIHFKRAAFRLSHWNSSPSKYELSSSGLLDAENSLFFANGLCKYYSHILGLFETSHAHFYALAFARLALLHLHDSSLNEEITSSLLNRLFCAALALGDFDSAAGALNRILNKTMQHSALRELVARIVECGAVHELFHLPLSNLHKDVDAVLAERALAEGKRGTAGPGRIPYFRILYAWRLRLGDVRGAAAVLVERLEALDRRSARQIARSGTGGGTRSNGHEQALDEYLVGINALALVGDGKGVNDATGDEGWVFVEPLGESRRIIRLQDLRNSYGREMDRLGMLEMGRFGIVSYDENADADDEAMDQLT